MDRMIFIAAQAAKNTMARQDNVANNMANVNTPGFRSQLMAFRSAPLQGPGQPTRAYAVESTVGADFSPGAMMATGRPLDVAIQGEGWLAVQGADGKEAYSRDGSLQLSADGTLVNQAGRAVLGDGGPLTVPPDHSVTIAEDGTVSAIPLTGQQTNVLQVGKLKLAKPDAKNMVRGDDGLFRPKNGQPAADDPTVRVASGMVEGSNVNAVDAMVQMINVARQFETHMKLISTAEANARAANQLFTNN